MSLINNIMGSETLKMSDQIIANDSIMGLKGLSAAYLTSTLESSTPEIRRLFSEYLSQSIVAHETMTGLAVKKGWYQPYINPEEQLAQIYKQSEWALDVNA